MARPNAQVISLEKFHGTSRSVKFFTSNNSQYTVRTILYVPHNNSVLVQTLMAQTVLCPTLHTTTLHLLSLPVMM